MLSLGWKKSVAVLFFDAQRASCENSLEVFRLLGATDSASSTSSCSASSESSTILCTKSSAMLSTGVGVLGAAATAVGLASAASSGFRTGFGFGVGFSFGVGFGTGEAIGGSTGHDRVYCGEACAAMLLACRGMEEWCGGAPGGCPGDFDGDCFGRIFARFLSALWCDWKSLS